MRVPSSRPGVGLGLTRDDPSDPTYRLALLSLLVLIVIAVSSLLDKVVVTPPEDDLVLASRQSDHHPTPRATARVPSPRQPYPRPYKDYEEFYCSLFMSFSGLVRI